MSEDCVPYLAGGEAAPPRLIPVFHLDRDALRRAVRNTLFELHQDRLQKCRLVGEAERLSRIALWEAVLGWVKEQRGDWINLVGPAR
jgi:hypothetical protein